MSVRFLLPLAVASLLTGCGLNPSTDIAPPTSGAAIRGNVHGGQQAVVGAHVYLFAANTTGYGGSSIAPSSNNASISLLNAASTGNSDALGAYVLTASDGSFSISGDYTCTANTQVYLYALGGNPGGGSNPNAGFLSILGNCPASGNFASTVPYVWMNEVTTAAAAYAFSGFASDATHVSTANVTSAKTGLANAFATAANLVNVATGTANSALPQGNGGIFLNTVNDVADILAACVNTAASTSGNTVTPSANCSVLFSTATSNSTSTGTQPTDTATAAINIAHFPEANLTALAALIPSSAPFSPSDSSFPFGLIVIAGFQGGGYNGASRIAIDASGNVWTAGAGNLSEFSPAGVPLSPSTGYVNSNVTSTGSMAISPTGNIWVLNSGTSSLFEFNSAGSVINTATLPATGNNIATDGSSNVWATNSLGVAKLSSSGSLLGNYTGGGVTSPSGIAISSGNNVWVGNTGSGSGISEFNSIGTAAASTPLDVSGITSSSFMSIDSSSNIWAMNANGTISAMTSAGSPLSGSPFLSGFSGTGTGLAIDGQNRIFATNYTTAGGSEILSQFLSLDQTGNVTPFAYGTGSIPDFLDVAIDNAGNVWVTSPEGLFEFIGLATPVTTPISAAVQTYCLGRRPCDLT